MLSACWLGVSLLQGLGISLASFRVTGGILLLLMALQILSGKSMAPELSEQERDCAAVNALNGRTRSHFHSYFICPRKPWLGQMSMRLLHHIMGLLLAPWGLSLFTVGVIAAFPILNG